MCINILYAGFTYAQTSVPVTWTTSTTVTQNGTLFTATGSTSSIVGNMSIEPNQNGWVKFKLNATVGNCTVGFGFADQANGTNQTFGNTFFNTAYNGGIYDCYAQAWSPSYHEWIQGVDNANTELKVERTGSTMNYYLNNVLKYSTSTLAGIRLVPVIVFYQGEAGKSVNVSADISSATSQNTPTQVVEFTYDETGNRIKRKVVTVVLPRSADKEIQANVTAPKFKLNIFPNPSDGHFDVTVENVEEGLVLNVYDASGKYVHGQPIAGLNTSVDISHLPRGIYVLVCRNAEKLRGQWKVVIQ